MTKTLFLDSLFSDTDQKESVLFFSDINIFLILRLDGLSYLTRKDKEDIELIQWRFVSGKLVVEGRDFVYHFTLAAINDGSMSVNYIKGVGGKVAEKGMCGIKIIDGVSSSDLEEMDLRDDKTIANYLWRTLRKDDNYKKMILPSLMLVFLILLIFKI